MLSLLFPGTQRQEKLVTLFGLSKIGSQVSFLVQWLKLKPAARTSEDSLNAIQFQMMLFESLSHSNFSNGITCVALQLVAVSVEPRPSVQGNFLNETRFCGPYKTTLKNKTAKKA